VKIKETLPVLIALALSSIHATAHAENITFDVSGSMNQAGVDYLGNGLIPCLGAGCLLGGTLLINTTTGAIVSADITITGETPVIGPFVEVPVETNILGVEQIALTPSPSGAVFWLSFNTPGANSLVGFAGGPLFDSSILDGFDYWYLTSGELTPEVAATPEPSSWLLVASGFFSILAFAAYESRPTALRSY
jgi:hypothetical protein